MDPLPFPDAQLAGRVGQVGDEQLGDVVEVGRRRRSQAGRRRGRQPSETIVWTSTLPDRTNSVPSRGS